MKAEQLFSVSYLFIVKRIVHLDSVQISHNVEFIVPVLQKDRDFAIMFHERIDIDFL